MSGPVALPSLDQFDFHPALAQTQGVVVVIFTAAFCASCRYWKVLLDAYARQREVRVFEVDAGRDQALAREFEVLHLPALFLFHHGHYHARLDCEARLEVLDAAIAAALARPAEEAP